MFFFLYMRYVYQQYFCYLFDIFCLFTQFSSALVAPDKTCPEGSLYKDTSRTVLWLSQEYGVLLRLT